MQYFFQHILNPLVIALLSFYLLSFNHLLKKKTRNLFFSCFSKRDRKSHRRLKKDTDFCSIVLYAFSYRNTFSFHPRAKHLTHQPAAALPPPPPSPSPSPSPPSVPWRSGKHVYVWQHSWQRWPTRNQQGECCCWKSV